MIRNGLLIIRPEEARKEHRKRERIPFGWVDKSDGRRNGLTDPVSDAVVKSLRLSDGLTSLKGGETLPRVVEASLIPLASMI
jgi:hypothetical protein